VFDMALFVTIPDMLFNPLASPGAPAYAVALLQIFAETRRHQQPLSRELAVSLVREVLAEAQDALVTTSDADEESAVDQDDDPLAARAGAVLRYLGRCGWLRIETQSDFSITLASISSRCCGSCRHATY